MHKPIRTIPLTGNKRVKPVIKFKRNKLRCTDRYIRDAGKAVRRMVEMLAEIRVERASMLTTDKTKQDWEKWIGKIIRIVARPNPIEYVYNLVKWYRDHYDDDKFIPRIESGHSLYRKFDRLQTARENRLGPADLNGTVYTPTELLQQHGFDGRMLAAMLRDVIPAAKGLELTDIKSESQLIKMLASLHNTIRQERDAANLSTDLKLTLGGPVHVLRSYLMWLGEKDWRQGEFAATSNVLKPDSPAFAQWRRYYQRLELKDPINGRQQQYR